MVSYKKLGHPGPFISLDQQGDSLVLGLFQFSPEFPVSYKPLSHIMLGQLVTLDTPTSQPQDCVDQSYD